MLCHHAFSFDCASSVDMQVVHPFQFMGGKYNDQLYEEQVRICAQAFVGDEALKAMVCDAATTLFVQLALSREMTKYSSTTTKYKNLTFEIHCGVQSTADDSSNNNRSTSSAGE